MENTNFLVQMIEITSICFYIVCLNKVCSFLSLMNSSFGARFISTNQNKLHNIRI